MGTQAGFKVLSAMRTMGGCSVTSTARCIVATTMATSSSAPLGQSGCGDVEFKWHTLCTVAKPFARDAKSKWHFLCTVVICRGAQKRPHQNQSCCEKTRGTKK